MNGNFTMNERTLSSSGKLFILFKCYAIFVDKAWYSKYFTVDYIDDVSLFLITYYQLVYFSHCLVTFKTNNDKLGHILTFIIGTSTLLDFATY